MLQNLRANANEAGDFSEINKIISYEHKSENEYLREAWKRKDSYYIEKYQGIDQFKVKLKYITHSLSSLVWGHGHSPFRFVIFNIIILLLFTGIITINNFKIDETVANNSIIIFEKAKECALIILSVINPKSQIEPLIYYFMVIYRCIFWSMLVNILFQRWVKK